MTKAEIVNEIAKKTGIEKSVVLTTDCRFAIPPVTLKAVKVASLVTDNLRRFA